jgi:hypothetical protein
MLFQKCFARVFFSIKVLLTVCILVVNVKWYELVLKHVSFTVTCYKEMFTAYIFKNLFFFTPVKIQPI